jgi:hypothetical protein
MSQHRRKTPDRPVTVFLVAFAAFFLAIAAWSLATPLMAAPDEPVQVAKAAAVVRGQLTGHLVGGPSSPLGVVTIPAAYANLGVLVHCYQFDANLPASCAPKYKALQGNVSDTIYNARYQPLYYAIVGLPSLFTRSGLGIYLMRLVSAALNALFLALAVMAAVRWSRSRLLLAGVMIAATPSVLFFAGVVNPTGFETSVAICLWTSLLVLMREQPTDAPRGLIALVAVSAGTEALVRSMSPFWVLLTLLTALGVSDWKSIGGLVRKREALIGAGFAAVCGAIGTAWILAEHSLNVLPPSAPIKRSVGEAHLLVLAFLRTAGYFTEMVSRFGWLVAPSPSATYLIWAGLLGAVVLLGLSVASARRCAVLGLLVIAVVVIPVLISAGQAHRIGITWQGKDTLPLAVGVPILAAMMFAGPLSNVRVLRQRFVGMVSSAAGVAAVVAFFGDLRRNAVGDNGADFSFLHAAWQPPLSIPGVLVLEFVAACFLVALFAVLGRQPSRGWRAAGPSTGGPAPPAADALASGTVQVETDARPPARNSGRDEPGNTGEGGHDA